jgi:hypothetical protein
MNKSAIFILIVLTLTGCSSYSEKLTTQEEFKRTEINESKKKQSAETYQVPKIDSEIMKKSNENSLFVEYSNRTLLQKRINKYWILSENGYYDNDSSQFYCNHYRSWGKVWTLPSPVELRSLFKDLKIAYNTDSMPLTMSKNSEFFSNELSGGGRTGLAVSIVINYPYGNEISNSISSTNVLCIAKIDSQKPERQLKADSGLEDIDNH